MNIKNKPYNIGISCIGSGVGQSVINSLCLSSLPIKTIGFGTNPFAYGAYDCDTYDYTKNIYEEGFIEDLIAKCQQHAVDLVIPGLDDEALLYSQHITKFEKAEIKAICASEELLSLCRDKERMSKELNKVENVFVETYEKDFLKNNLTSGKFRFPLITKPRTGFASTGVEIIKSEADLFKIKEENIIQELAMPKEADPNYAYFMSEISKNRNPQVAEISIQLVYSNDGSLLGRMASYNKLKNGIPIEIIPYENDYIWSIVNKLSPVFLSMGLRGPLNLQGRLTDNGLKIFEMNPRFTGITGLRALMGFNEVEACVKEWLGLDKGHNQITINYGKFGTRQTSDRAVSLDRNKEVITLSQAVNNHIAKKKKTILITGACGYLGQSLIRQLSKNEQLELWAFDLNKEKTTALFENIADKIYDKNDIETGRLALGNVDILTHLGFTRPRGTYEQIASSLAFTSMLFSKAIAHQVPAVINISSQSVYGLETPPPWTEQTLVSPSTPYAQAKYATELLIESLAASNKALKYCSLRLAALSGGAPGLVEVDFLSKFVRQVTHDKPIHVVGGQQKMERLDIRDAVDAIERVINTDPLKWKTVYNLGSSKIYSLIDIAKKVINVAKKHDPKIRATLTMEEKEVKMNFGMDSSQFYNDMEWYPQSSIDDTIASLIAYFEQN